MAVKSAPFYWVVCDRCGAHSGGEEEGAWVDAEQALIVADLSEWSITESRHLCWDCGLIEGRTES